MRYTSSLEGEYYQTVDPVDAAMTIAMTIEENDLHWLMGVEFSRKVANSRNNYILLTDFVFIILTVTVPCYLLYCRNLQTLICFRDA